MNRLTIDLLEHAGNLAGVLGPDPVELETVGDENRDPGKVVGHLGGQGFDPGVELLFGQLLGQLVDAGLPQAVARPGCQAAGDSLAHYWLSPLWIFFIVEAGRL
mgnify:CR=1 FL=1